ncbi:MAG TPA: ABC transporter ATP-binding protein [Fibrobacteraceae bacterium]|nr:ABC transporter ATP-binding protein [Fibrobacteraceae bacterium]
MSGEFSIETQGLTRCFGSFTAVDGIDVQVRRGEIYGFLGANGAGKTTAIRMLCGLLPPSTGTGYVAGCDIVRETAHIRTRIGYMSQKFSLYPDLTVAENLRLYMDLYAIPRAQMRSRLDEALTRTGIGKFTQRLTGTLPWGWQQRVSLACATAHHPEILFLDEPTGSVDPLSRRVFWDLIRAEAERGITIFVTTHYMDEAEYCHRACFLVDGRIAALGTPEGLKKRHGVNSLQDVFLTVAQKAVRS